ncbi:MAG: glycerol-3-phosphate 1-O-acyltransferase PlsY [Spirochaetes bacterium]|nr:glycerol-3-phosphate 1-O-acyltransferase PlsY [Spirochaetota bacterium]
MGIVVIALLSYLAGSAPTAFLVGRARGLDIRKLGSGNSGATNALRVLGPAAALAVLAVDAGKGALAVLAIAPLATSFLPTAFGWAATIPDTAMRAVAGSACILGHVFPVWLRFKGGKGVATGAAVVAALAPGAAIACLAVFAAALALTRYVSLGSVAAALALPAAYAGLYRGEAFSPWLFWFFSAAAALVVAMHRKNLARLAGGTEPRLGEEKRPRP